jgi:hypothetical protein
MIGYQHGECCEDVLSRLQDEHRDMLADIKDYRTTIATLLAALQKIADGDYGEDEYADTIARAAIAKATGEA